MCLKNICKNECMEKLRHARKLFGSYLHWLAVLTYIYCEVFKKHFSASINYWLAITNTIININAMEWQVVKYPTYNTHNQVATSVGWEVRTVCYMYVHVA